MKKNNNKGFTFIELILYMGILAIFMVAVTTLVGSVTSSNRKMTARKKIQNQASEAYDSLSDMFMSAVDVRIYGTAYITLSGSSSPTQKTGVFLIPDSTDTKEDTGELKDSNGNSREMTIAGDGKSCYDIADIVSFGDVDAPSDTEETYIDAEYIYIKYASGIDSSGDSIYTCCTLKYDNAADKIYVYKVDSTDTTNYSSYESKFVDASSLSDSVFCKYVSEFKLQVNPDEDSFAITLDLEDSSTSESYSVNGVVNMRNSYVLKAHTWD